MFPETPEMPLVNFAFPIVKRHFAFHIFCFFLVFIPAGGYPYFSRVIIRTARAILYGIFKLNIMFLTEIETSEETNYKRNPAFCGKGFLMWMEVIILFFFPFSLGPIV